MKKLLCLLLAAMMLLLCVSCGTGKGDDQTSDESSSQPTSESESESENETEKLAVNVYVITGPTGIGAVHMWNESEEHKGTYDYRFTAVTTPTEVVSKLSKGEADIAAIATNLAAKVYKATEKGVKVIAVNTLGVLNVLTKDGPQITSWNDLKGRKVVTTGQGANPEFIIRYLMNKNGVDPDNDLTIEYKAEGTELVTVWAKEPEAVIIAPQPVATAILKKYEGSSIAMDLTEEWKKADPDSQLMMGCVVVRTEFLNAHPEAVEDFLSDYEKSVKAANDDPAATAELCVKYGIVAQAPVAQAAIPHCHITFVTGEEMKAGLDGYLRVLLEADASSIGGSMPDDDFYYNGKAE